MTKNWKNLCRRGLSLLVCLVMCLSMLPGAAYAESGLTCTYKVGIITCENELTYVPRVEPTCQNEGIEAHYNCNRPLHGDRNYDLNGNHLSGPVERIPKVSCDYQLVSSTATCGAEGTATYKCRWCASIKEETVSATGNHSYEWDTTNEPTCGEEGSKTGKCSVCGDETTQSIDKTPHTPDEAVSENDVDVTCTTPGSYEEVVYCSVCEAEISRETKTIDPINHEGTGRTYTEIEGTGQHTVECNFCKAELGKEDHELSHREDDPAGHHYTCICGKEEIQPHTYGDWKVIIQPTATEEGTKRRECDVCTFGEEETLPPLGHEFSEEWTSDDSSHWRECLTAGCDEKQDLAEHSDWTDGACGVCGYICEHTAKIQVPGTAKAAACEEDGKEADEQCVACGMVFEGKVIPSQGHTYDNGTWVFETTRLRGSSTTYTATGTLKCTKCDDSYSVQSVSTKSVRLSGTLTCEKDASVKSATVSYIDKDGVTVTVTDVSGVAKAPGHNWSAKWSMSTWTPKSHAKKCQNTYSSGKGCTVESEVAAHTTVYTVTKAATCEESGIYAYPCTVCSADTNYNSKGGYIEPLGHAFDSYNYNGTSHWQTCGREGCSEVQKAAHELTTTVVTTPTCIKEGEAQYTCETCGYSHKASIPATGEHHYVDDKCEWCGEVDPGHKHIYDMENGTVLQPATCTDSGMTAYGCTLCDAQLRVVTLMLGHDYAVTVENATCIEKGVKTFACTRCGDSYTETLPLVPHTLTAAAEVPASCEADGMRAHSTCSVCGGFFTGSGTSLQSVLQSELVIPATGHAYGAWTITVQPTTDAPGMAEQVCGNDEDHVNRVEIPQLPAPGTSNDVWTLDGEASSAPTCTEDGANVYISEYGTVTVEIPALGHDLLTAWTYDGASHWHVCSRCGAVSAAAAHTYDGGVVTQAPTADAAGVRTYACTVCGSYYTEAIPATGTTTPVFPAPDPGTTGGGTGGSGAGSPAGPTETIIDEDVPLAGIIFEDVLPTDPFYEAVQYVYNRGLMNGVSDTSFDPYGTLTRAMVVTILYRLEGEPAAEPSSFKDVPAGTWYTEAIGWGAANEIVKGYSEDRFGPMDPVTREQLAAILYRYAQYKGYDVTETADLTVYADMVSISEYALEAMAWAAAIGAPEALSETSLAPRDNATRAQVAVAFMNFCEKYVPLETEGEAA